VSGFPRNWTLTTAVSSPSTPNLSLPATDGIVHVLDSFYTRIYAAGTAGGGQLVAVQCVGAVTTTIGELVIGANAYTGDDQTGTALDLASSPGGTLVVQWTAPLGANYGGFLVIQGHDI
jgi:hypothetical protein